MRLLDLKAGERVLLVGVGTGADLPLLPEGVYAVGVDLSPDMLARARSKLPLLDCPVILLEGDAQSLLVETASYDSGHIQSNSVRHPGRSSLPAGELAAPSNRRAGQWFSINSLPRADSSLSSGVS